MGVGRRKGTQKAAAETHLQQEVEIKESARSPGSTDCHSEAGRSVEMGRSVEPAFENPAPFLDRGRPRPHVWPRPHGPELRPLGPSPAPDAGGARPAPGSACPCRHVRGRTGTLGTGPGGAGTPVGGGGAGQGGGGVVAVLWVTTVNNEGGCGEAPGSAAPGGGGAGAAPVRPWGRRGEMGARRGE